MVAPVGSVIVPLILARYSCAQVLLTTAAKKRAGKTNSCRVIQDLLEARFGCLRPPGTPGVNYISQLTIKDALNKIVRCGPQCVPYGRFSPRASSLGRSIWISQRQPWL